jgi:dihydrofolate reductase
MDSYDAMLLGRKTYEDFAAYWPHAPQDDPFSAIMNGRTKYVVSTTLERADWANSHLLKGDWAAQVADLKQQPGKNISVVGSGTLVRSLLRHRLLDELQLMVCPVILGVGARLYDGIDFMQTTKVLESQSFSTGMTFLRLQPL